MPITYMTKEGYKKKMEEISRLESIERPRISRAIAEARDKGDLSENSEYDAAKEAQGLLEMKIAQLKDLVAGARIIGCAPLQTLILGSGFGERPDGDDQASTRPLDTATLEPSPQTLEQFTLNFLAFRGVKLSRKTMQKALGLNKDQMTQLLDQLELSGKIERHTHAKSTTYSLAHASGR